jgi:hypothetical protein
MATPEERAAISAAEQRLATAERQEADANLRLLRHEVGMELKLDPVISSRLVGSTREEMVADAKQFGATVKAVREPGAKDEPSVNDWIRRAAGRGSSSAEVEDAEPPRTVSVDGGARQSIRPGESMNDLIRGARERRWG